MIQSNLHSKKTGKTVLSFVGYLTVGLWFLLTVLASTNVRAETDAAPVVLSASDILPDIEAALIQKGMPEGAEIRLTNPLVKFIVNGDIDFTHISYNPSSGRFVMRLANAQHAITGAARLSESFPVLTRTIARGELITDGDIAFVETSDMRSGHFVHNASDLVGKEARRPLRSQTPVRTSDVAAPVLVKKGALVTLTYHIEGLKLTHQGVAMTAGSEGDIISIQNAQSERTLKGVIAGRNHVRIATPGTISSAEGS